MTDYSAMSDFEINCAVAAFLGDMVFDSDAILSSDRKHKTYRINDRYRDVYSSGWSTDSFDPCNSWADAGPIIQEYGIGIMPFKRYDAKAWDLKCGLIGDVEHKCPNVLRAAMIVFLMMKEQP